MKNSMIHFLDLSNPGPRGDMEHPGSPPGLRPSCSGPSACSQPYGTVLRPLEWRTDLDFREIRHDPLFGVHFQPQIVEMAIFPRENFCVRRAVLAAGVVQFWW